MPDMPYRCQDLSCLCHQGANPWPWEETLHFSNNAYGYEVEVRDEEEHLVDVFQDHNLSTLVEMVHRNYPHARKVR